METNTRTWIVMNVSFNEKWRFGNSILTHTVFIFLNQTEVMEAVGEAKRVLAEQNHQNNNTENTMKPEK